MAGTEEASLRAEIAAAQRRRDRALAQVAQLREEHQELSKPSTSELTAKGGKGNPARSGRVAGAGDRVRIFGFTGSPQLNGQEATLLSRDDKKGGRCRVRLASGEHRQVPAANLEVVAAAATKEHLSDGAPSLKPVASSELQRPSPQPRVTQCDEPMSSASGMRVHSTMSPKAGGVPCELWPLVHSTMARCLVDEQMLARLNAQLDAAVAAIASADHRQHLLGEIRSGCQVALTSPDQGFRDVLVELCCLLAWSVLGTKDFRCELDSVWGVVQKEGDYSPIQTQRNRKSPFGFSSLLDVRLPPALSEENQLRPSKGSFGWHDGGQCFLWKGDTATDRENLVQPGIIQCELTMGYLYVFPQWVNHYTYPFDGAGERRWIGANVALLDVAPDAHGMSCAPPAKGPFAAPALRTL